MQVNEDHQQGNQQRGYYDNQKNYGDIAPDIVIDLLSNYFDFGRNIVNIQAAA